MTTIDDKIAAHNSDTTAHDYIHKVIGVLENLNTADKTNIVNAINEAKNDVDGVSTSIDAAIHTTIPNMIDKLDYLKDAIDAIQDAIISKNIDVPDDILLSSYPAKVNAIEVTPPFNVYFHSNTAPADNTKLWCKYTISPSKIYLQNKLTFRAWESLANMVGTTDYTSTYGFAVYCNGKIYVRSCAVDETDNYFYAYDIANNSWTALPTMDNYITYALLNVDGKLYSIGCAASLSGVTVSIWQFDIDNAAWTLKKQYTRAHYPSIRAAVLNGIIYMAYEYMPGIWHMQTYNPQTDDISGDLNLSISKTDGSDIVLAAGESTIFCVTGSTVYEYDPTTNVTSTIGSLLAAIPLSEQKSVVYANGKLYFGKCTYSGATVIQTFDITSRAAATIPQVNNGNMIAFDGDSRLYLFGYWVYGSPETGIASSYNISDDVLVTGEVAIIIGGAQSANITMINGSGLTIIAPIKTAYRGVSGGNPAVITCAVWNGSAWQEVN